MREAHHPRGFHRCQRCLETNNMSPKILIILQIISQIHKLLIIYYKHKVIFMWKTNLKKMLVLRSRCLNNQEFFFFNFFLFEGISSFLTWNLYLSKFSFFTLTKITLKKSLYVWIQLYKRDCLLSNWFNILILILGFFFRF